MLDDVLATPGPKVFVNTVPRSGTHLLDSILGRIPGMRRQQRIGLNARLRWHPLNWLPFGGEETCLAGIGRPQLVKLASARHAVGRIRPWHYAQGNMPYDSRLMDHIAGKRIIVIVGVRDPRDTLVSALHLIAEHRTAPPYRRLMAIDSERERLRALFFDQSNERGILRAGAARQMDYVLGWVEDPRVLAVRFEDLVGSQGGGDDAAQRSAIRRVARHVGVPIDDNDADRIGREMFGTGKTFRKGQIGLWRKYFDDELSGVFEAAVGDRLRRLGYLPSSPLP